MSVSKTFRAHSLELLSILVCPFSPSTYQIPSYSSGVHLPPPTLTEKLPLLPCMLIVLFSELLPSLAFDQSLNDIDMNPSETHWARRGITEHLVQPLCFIDKETVLQRVRASRQRSLRVSSQVRTRILASWLLLYIFYHFATQLPVFHSSCQSLLLVVKSCFKWNIFILSFPLEYSCFLIIWV